MTTTIEIRDGQKAALDDLKVADSESYKDVLQRLIEDYSDSRGLTEDRVRELAREEVRDAVVFEALE
jgi:predicted CopG family antitoxin